MPVQPGHLVIDGAGDTAASFPLYHWAPSSRRKSIVRFGLRPGHWSTDRLWKPPCICLCDSPSLAWSLSAMTERGAEHPSWDLWVTWNDRLAGYEQLPMWDGSGRIAEYRVYERIFKRDVWMVGTRERDQP